MGLCEEEEDGRKRELLALKDLRESVLNLCLFLKIRIRFCFGEKNNILFLILFFIFKILRCADVENCGISGGFGFVYILVANPCDAWENY